MRAAPRSAWEQQMTANIIAHRVPSFVHVCEGEQVCIRLVLYAQTMLFLYVFEAFFHQSSLVTKQHSGLDSRLLSNSSLQITSSLMIYSMLLRATPKNKHSSLETSSKQTKA